MSKSRPGSVTKTLLLSVTAGIQEGELVIAPERTPTRTGVVVMGHGSVGSPDQFKFGLQETA